MEKERRYVKVDELRAMDSVRGPIIEGHAAVFNQPSLEIFGVTGWREVIRPGAFAKVIKTDDVCALIEHDTKLLIGRVSNNTLELKEDAYGLHSRIFPPDTSDTRDLLVKIRGGYIAHMSFGFRVDDDESAQKFDRENKLRVIHEFRELFDVSPVAQPAYRQTDVSARSRDLIANLKFDLKEAVEEFVATKLKPQDDEKFKAECLALRQLTLSNIARNTKPDPSSILEEMKRCCLQRL